MMKRNVYLLVLAVVTIFIGVSMPELAEPLEHVPAAQMLVQLLLCFMATGEPASAPSLASMRGLPRYLAYKMLIIPLICWGVTRLLFPEFALAALLLSSSSIAVMAPFMAYLAGGDGAFVVGGVVVSSLMLPVTLPFLAGIALFVDGKEVSGLVQSCLNTALYLAVSMLIPFLVSRLLWAKRPGICTWFLKHRFWISMGCVAGCNLGVFSRYSEPFLGNLNLLGQAALVCVLLAVLLLGFGLLLGRKDSLELCLGKVIGLACMNNVLILIISASFFNIPEVLLSALYTAPFLAMGIPLQLCRKWLEKRANS